MIIGMQIVAAILGNGLAVSYEVKHKLTISPNSPTHLGIYSREMTSFFFFFLIFIYLFTWLCRVSAAVGS